MSRQQTAIGVRLVLIVLAVAFAGITASMQAPAVPRNAAIDRVLSEAVARGDVPGIVAMATDKSGVLYQGAFGVADLGTRRPLAADAIFRIASMTKPITSLAAMQLVEQGRLRLDDRADKYLPELAGVKLLEQFDAKTGSYTSRPATKPITLRHLLTHTSGLGYNFTSPVIRDFKPREGDQFPVGPLMFEPGEQWLYGTSTDLVGRIVETISGQNLEEYFRARIMQPLAMHDTSFNVPPEKQARLASAHRRRPDGMLEVNPNQPAPLVTRFNGGGGLASTAGDYIRFIQMYLNGGTLNGARIASAETIRTMSASHIGSVGVPALKSAMPDRSGDFTFVADGRDKFGLGFLITVDNQSGKRSGGTLSWAGINNTYFWIDPARGIGGVVMMQFLPFADAKALAVLDAFERGVYALSRTTTSASAVK